VSLSYMKKGSNIIGNVNNVLEYHLNVVSGRNFDSRLSNLICVVGLYLPKDYLY
jgi:hypothetical protein